MKRDYKLVRRILLAMEEQPPGDEGRAVVFLAEEGTDAPTVISHMELMMDEGLVGEHRPLIRPAPDGVSLRITSPGRDFLDSVRDESRLDTVLAEIRKHGLPLTLRLLIKMVERLVAMALP